MNSHMEAKHLVCRLCYEEETQPVTYKQTREFKNSYNKEYELKRRELRRKRMYAW